VIFVESHWGSGAGAVAEARRTIAGILSAYSGILFVDQPLIGIAYLAGTFWFPNVGLAGLLGAAVGMTVGYVLRLPYATSGVNVYSSLLVGLSLGAYYQLSGNLALLIMLSAALTVLLAASLRSFLWRLGHLPVLSVPFVIVALTSALAASTYGGLDPYYPPSQLPPSLLGAGFVLGAWLDTFLAALGSTFFSPHPAVGALLFLGIVLRSRYLALLCVAGFLAGEVVYTTLMQEPPEGLLAWTGFNFSLTAMALGGVFTVPSLAAFAFGVVGAGASAIVSGALARFLLVYNLPVMALPFLLTTLTLLAALRLRVSTAPPVLLLEQPGLPEVNYERARLAKARLGSLGSVPLIAPFLGEWHVYQGFDGPHTHRDQWRYALDFHRIEDGKSYERDGASLDDYYCFGLPVLSPAYGLVVETKDSQPDNAPGDLDLKNNWGNYVLIEAYSGLFVLLAHLQQGSVKVNEGARVTPNSVIASCGNSGRSAQPHLHLQVQRHGSLGGATVPFHIVSAIVGTENEPPRYQVVAEATEGSSVRRAEEDRALAAAMQLPVGRMLKYRCVNERGHVLEVTMRVEVTLLGQFRIVADSGASAAFEHRNGTLAFYDRQGPKDSFLDLWLLALGLTPLSSVPQSWEDSPSIRLVPASTVTRIWWSTVRPLGAGLKSRYSRSWSEGSRQWQQTATHEFSTLGKRHQAKTSAILSEQGCISVDIESDEYKLRADLIGVGQRADRGVPAWEQAVDDGKQLPTDIETD
jgi:urea transporter/murein DD-endopeptidase MepM/ murein hydrolase activator NlpD